MISRFLSVGWAGGVLLALGLHPSPGLAGGPSKGSPPATSAPNSAALDSVQAALEAEASGDQARREELLRKALAADPECVPARGYAGYVRVGDQWLPVDEAEQRAKGDKRLAEYRRLRDAQAGNPLGELVLARFCSKNGLETEAEYHWRRVLSLDPRNREAVRRLGLRRHNGHWLTPAQIADKRERQSRFDDERRERAESQKRWEKHWTPLVAAWFRTARGGDSVPTSSIDQELKALDGLDTAELQAALTGLDAAIREACDWGDNKELEVVRQVSKAAVELLDKTSAPWAASRLAEMAVGHPMEDVRTAAGDALAKRPMESYVPMLLGRMATPIEVGFTIVAHPSGSVSYQQSFFREGLDVDYYTTYTSSMRLRGEPDLSTPPPARAIPDWVSQVGETETVPFYLDGRYRGEVSLSDYVRQCAAGMESKRFLDLQQNRIALARIEAMASAAMQAALGNAAAIVRATQYRVGWTNLAISFRNARIQDVLRRATGQDLGDDPKQWWQWWRERWYDRYELEKPSEQEQSEYARHKPVYEQHYQNTHYVSLPSRPAPCGSNSWFPESRPTEFQAATKHSCFARGTTVWTVTGAVPIEQIKPGDRVLSQNPESGELAYKPVLQTTIRQPSPMVKIHLGSDLIEATRGHPFYVSGKGWRMAKEIEPGDRLRAVGGAPAVDRVEQTAAPGPWYEHVEESPDAAFGYGSAYNLIVDDFHTFFIGDGRILAHDNTADGAPFGRVPGLPR